MASGKTQKPADGSALEFEAQLWAAADKMRGHMDASEYKAKDQRLKAKMAGIARIDQPHKHNHGFFVRMQRAGNVFGAEARLPQSQTVGHSRSTRRLAEHGMRALNYESKNERYTA